MGLVELEKLVLEWASERGLLKAENAEAQANKLFEEIGEFAKEVNKGDMEAAKMELGYIIVVCINYSKILGLESFADTVEMLVFGADWRKNDKFSALEWNISCFAAHGDELGSQNEAAEAVQGLCAKIGTTPLAALSAAYNKIKNRKGKTVGGTFVKDSGVQFPVSSYCVDGKHTFIEKSYHDMWRVAKQGNVMSAKDGQFYWLRFVIETQADIAEYLFATPEQAYEKYLEFYGQKQQ